MKKLLNSSLAIFALAFALLFTGKTAWAATTTGGSTVTSITAQDINKSGAKTYSTVVASMPGSEIVPIKVSSPGVLKLTITGTKTDQGILVSLHTASVPTNNNMLNYVEFSSVTQGQKQILYANLTSKGTYYLCVQMDLVGADQQIDYTVQEYVQGGTLTMNKALKAGVTADKDGLYKIKVTKTGILKVKLSEIISSGNAAYGLRLYNSKKKPYSSSKSSYGVVEAGKTGYFAVKKGTYYIGVSTMSYNGSKVYPTAVSLKPTFTTWSDGLSKNTTKAKAKTVAKGKTVKSMVLPSDATSKAKWIKVNMSKNAALLLTVQSYMSAGELKVTVSSNKLRVPVSGTITGAGSYKNPLTVTGVGNTKLYKGTYYIKITPAWKGSSGAYSVKVSYK